MSNPRIRRLRLDHERLNNRFQAWNAVQISGLIGTPPEQYLVTYAVKGIYAAPDGRILERDQHTVEINLSLAYPRRAPHCKMLTPIFHPNFDETTVCIGDFWAASEGLDELIIRIGRMIAYQEYNTKSPLNGLAARWADEHSHMLPVDSREIAPPLSDSLEELQDKLVVELVTDNKQNNDTLLIGILDLNGNQRALADALTTIGRAPGNMIQLPDTGVSWYHAHLIRTDHGFLLCDLSSSNGTWVNETRIQSNTLLNSGDIVRVGATELGRFVIVKQ